MLNNINPDPIEYLSKISEELSNQELELNDDSSRLMGRMINLQQKYSWLVDLIDEFPYAVARINCNLNYLYVNNAYAYFFNKSREEILFSTVQDVIGETAFNGSRLWIKKVLTGEHVHFENSVINGLGQLRYVMATLIPEFDAEKKVIGYYAFLQDITEKINDVEAIKESEKRYRELVDNADVIIFTADFTGAIKSVNPAFELILGYSPDFITGRNLGTIVTPKSVIEVKTDLERKKKGLSPGATFVLTFIARDGNLVDLEIRSRTLYREGKPSHVLGIGRDISDQKKSVAMLMQAKSDWEATFNTIEDLILITDSKGIVQRHNKAARSWIKAEKDLTGQNISTLFFEKTIPADDFFTLNGEIRFSRLPGVYNISSYSIPEGNLGQRYLTIVRNLTEQKRYEETLISTQRLAELGGWAAGILHDIRSPLQVVTGVSDTLLKKFQRDELNAPQMEEKLISIRLNAQRMYDVVNASLDYSRLVEQDLTTCDLNTIVRETLVLLHHQLHQWTDIEVKTDLSTNPVIVSCRPNTISQALVNLILNAFDALTNGGWVVIRTLHSSKNGDPVLIVEDNGIGIPKDIQEQVFAPFFTTKPFGKGTGLGLSNVQKIIQDHGGFIELDSAPGRGSKFSLVFPKNVPEN